MAMNEAAIRDNLGMRLDLFEPGLELFDIQQLFGCHWDGVMVDYSEAEQYGPST